MGSLDGLNAGHIVAVQRHVGEYIDRHYKWGVLLDRRVRRIPVGVEQIGLPCTDQPQKFNFLIQTQSNG